MSYGPVCVRESERSMAPPSRFNFRGANRIQVGITPVLAYQEIQTLKRKSERERNLHDVYSLWTLTESVKRTLVMVWCIQLSCPPAATWSIAHASTHGFLPNYIDQHPSVDNCCFDCFSIQFARPIARTLLSSSDSKENPLIIQTPLVRIIQRPPKRRLAEETKTTPFFATHFLFLDRLALVRYGRCIFLVRSSSTGSKCCGYIVHPVRSGRASASLSLWNFCERVCKRVSRRLDVHITVADKLFQRPIAKWMKGSRVRTRLADACWVIPWRSTIAKVHSRTQTTSSAGVLFKWIFGHPFDR